ncbi:thiopurine S-methyltransferase [Vibrio sp. PP-XX7]
MMHGEFWHSKWAANQIGFHLDEENPFLLKYWSATSPTKSDTVLVPLCGKSEDLVWLATQHENVYGVELSDIAVKAFFAEHFYTPIVSHIDSRHSLYQFDEISLYQGDIFTSPLPCVDIIYDRAALVAIAPEQRTAYADRLVSLLNPGGRILLVTADYPQHERAGPPFSLPQADIETLFAGATVSLLCRDEADPSHPQIRKKGLSYFSDEVWLIKF